MSDVKTAKTKIKVKVKASSPRDAIQGLKDAVAPLNWSKGEK